ncbi:MAG TPA: thioredoxin domain-containing protein [Thermosynechococcaceae cyanobacterium]
MSNRLAQSESLYLQKHAENPIDWWSWCNEALETAQREDKPIFLSIGYSSCHWCTVMEGEAFSDPTIAEYINANFLPIKVDREERPDLDSLYMQTLQMMVGQGGWPLNIFLSPDDRFPFYGGTYFPLEPRYGRPGFLQVLQALRRYYDTDKEKLQGVKTEILANLRSGTALEPATIAPDLLRRGLEVNTQVLLSEAMGPSFPMIPYAEVAQRSIRLLTASAADPEKASRKRGLDLSLGGVFDQVGGGFHRYTVDPTWTVPHFEKMLYDNGQIVEYLANLWSAGVQEPAFERAIALTVQWLQREMRSSEGFFYAAQDADSFAHATEAEPEEGAFYVWDYSTLAETLSVAELAELAQHFTVTETGNFEGVNVLQRRSPGPLADSLEASLNKLFYLRYGGPSQLPIPAARNNAEAKRIAWAGRIPPVTDTKMIVAWNSLMISGLARSTCALNRPADLDLAITAAQFILDRQWLEGRFHRINYNGQPQVLAQSEDYALFIKALLDLHQATQWLTSTVGQAEFLIDEALLEQYQALQQNWLTQAVRVQAEFDEFLWSIELGGYYNTDARDDLLVRERSYIDTATPSANGVAVVNLVRLALLTEDLSYLDKADRTLQAFASVMARSPQACPTLFSGLDWFQNHLLVRTTADAIVQLSTQYWPTAVFKLEPELPPGAIGLVCRGLSCDEPARDWAHLQAQMQQLAG